MLTIKWTDRDGYERIVEGEDVSAKMDGKQATMVCFRGAKGYPHLIDFPTTVYVMSAAGATVGKYVVCPELADVSNEVSDGWIEWSGGDMPVRSGVRVEYRMRDGATDSYGVKAHILRWDHAGTEGDIIAYRVVP